MSYIKTYLKRRAEGRLRKEEQERNALRMAFTRRYLSFKTLLGLNDEVLKIISNMEEAIEGSVSFDMAFIRTKCTALSVDVYKIIQSLNDITDQRNQTLFSVFDEISRRIDQELTRKREAQQGSWILPLEAIDRNMTDQAGNKMASLAETRNRLGLAVPEGFVISSAAYEFFMAEGKLQDEVNRQLQQLEVGNIAQLHEVSADLQKLIVEAPLPAELERTIISAYQDLIRNVGEGACICLRSSALGEDSRGASFAGQYRSILNVSPESLLLGYKEVVASKYSVPAITYRLRMGFLDEDIAMCVGCMRLIQAEAAGVVYSADPGASFPGGVVINSAFGLGKAVVDGTFSSDLYVVSRKDPGQLLEKDIRSKTTRIACHSREGVVVEHVDEAKREAPSLSDEQARRLAKIAMRLEEHFGGAQDVEWALDNEGTFWIVQTRPLALPARSGSRQDLPSRLIDNTTLIEKGITASPGVAYGPAFRVETAVDMLQFPTGAVLLARYPLPQWAALLDKAVAVVTDEGTLTGHLAAVAREFKIPALMGTRVASSTIGTGTLVTVDADLQKVYAGKVEAILARSSESASPIKNSPVYHTLENVLRYIAPLHLTDPDGPDFTPQDCQTLHDIIRYAHEISLRELFDEYQETPFSHKMARKLVSNVPMEWWVLDLGGGIREKADGDTVRVEDIISPPFCALWEGLTAFPWKGPPPIDAGGFLSIVIESTMDPNLELGRESAMGGQNYVIVSQDFFHLSTKLGFHYSTVEAFLGERVTENYVWFYFKGGAADRQRKERRNDLIETVLRRFHFWVQTKGDTLSARLERQENEYMTKGLKVLGYLILHTRQLDMVLSDPARVTWYAEEMLGEVSTFVEVPD
ncbi:MAG TPA: PEP/pyruvate-binding domain-containing protein [Syntrophorhabdales bacterium]|nr:PEP/pyruvate-binding domain-containing protein [Syntrophorhabdales bacterium]